MTVTPMVRTEVDDRGRMVRAWVPSKSRAGVMYEMVRSGLGWAHTDTSCPAWTATNRCYHIAACEGVTVMTEEERSITVQMSPLALLDSVDLEQVMSAKLIPSERHMYSFRQKGELVEGVSIDGVRDAARALSTKGEAIREEWVKLDREDDRDAYFIACAARYAVAPDGREICMDTAIRAKRQPKWGKKRDPKPGEPSEYFIDAWYEIGVAKAVRNATEALLPEAMKEYIKDQARQLARGGARPTQEQRREAQHRTSGPTAAGKANPKAEAMALIKQAHASDDADAIKAELIDLFPDIFDAKGTYVLSEATVERVGEVATFLRTRLANTQGALA